MFLFFYIIYFTFFFLSITLSLYPYISLSEFIILLFSLYNICISSPFSLPLHLSIFLSLNISFSPSFYLSIALSLLSLYLSIPSYLFLSVSLLLYRPISLLILSHFLSISPLLPLPILFLGRGSGPDAQQKEVRFMSNMSRDSLKMPNTEDDVCACLGRCLLVCVFVCSCGNPAAFANMI